MIFATLLKNKWLIALAAGLIFFASTLLLSVKWGESMCRAEIALEALEASEKTRKDYEEIDKNKPSDADTVAIAGRLLQRTVGR